MARRLLFNVAANRFTNVFLKETAVGSEPGYLDIYVDNARYGHASAMIHEGKPQRVPVQPLLNVCRDAGIVAIGVLKIDIEGYEDRALLPFFASAPRSLRPWHVFIEVAQRATWQSDCLARLEAYGYVVRWSSQEDVFLERQD